MTQSLIFLVKKILYILVTILIYPLKYIIPKQDIIVLCTHSRKQYSNNTKYLYQYLVEKSEYKVYWVTDHIDIMKYLDRKDMRFISTKFPIKMIWILLRTKIIVDSGTKFFNPFKILTNNSTIKITTNHGSGPKATFSRFHPPDNSEIAIEQIISHYSFDYVNYPSQYSTEKVAKRNHLLPNEKIISLGYPRCDQYFDSEFVNKNYESKATVKSLCPNYNDNAKVIFYTPTWRPYDFEFPLYKMPGFNVIEFNEWLKKSNFYFFYSIHSVQLPTSILREYDRIVFIDYDENPFFDVNQFMMEVDILFNDYSTTSTEFAILDKPQLFFMPDYDDYSSEKGFIEEYRDILPGKEINIFSELTYSLEYIVENQTEYIAKYKDKSHELLEKYYDLNEGNSSQMFNSFIDDILR